MPPSSVDREPLDIALDILADQYRRRLLVALIEHKPQDGDEMGTPAEATVEGEDPATTRIRMVHTHLPKMEDAGFIRWNEETDKVRRGPRFEEISPLLELMRTHSDELPYGCL